MTAGDYAWGLFVAVVGFVLACTVLPEAINIAIGALCFLAFMGVLDLIER